MLLHSNDICAKRETLQNQPGCLSPATPDNSISEEAGKVCKEGYSHSARNNSSSTVLQSLTEIDKLCTISRFLLISSNREIQCTPTLISGGKSRPHMVGSICQGGCGEPHLSPSEGNINRVRCFQLRMGNTNGQDRTGDCGQLWSQHIIYVNYLELLAVFLALKTSAKDLSYCTVLVKSDNISALIYINQKGVLTPSSCAVGNRNLGWCLTHRITFVAEHLPGIANMIAEQESRTTQDCLQLDDKLLIFSGHPKATGFTEGASRLTKLLPQFYNRRSDPDAEATDAFTHNWALSRGFANPPWHLINRCLCQVAHQQVRIVLLSL